VVRPGVWLSNTSPGRQSGNLGTGELQDCWPIGVETSPSATLGAGPGCHSLAAGVFLLVGLPAKAD
jgi:hypothetical protein